jgi:hypothetical protein
MTISTTGTHFFTEEIFQPGRLVLMGLSGTFGGSTVTLGYKVGAAFVPFVKEDGTSVTLTSPGGFQARVMSKEGTLAVSVTGGTTRSIDFEVIPAVDMPNRL